ncbi:hypothetical protein AS96_10525 [Microbacterium sp. MRS-1]|nr:hypothetical protein AS96_10525 [Microbacterium sp. MRS-1]
MGEGVELLRGDRVGVGSVGVQPASIAVTRTRAARTAGRVARRGIYRC